jgi:hypothetical protein
MPLPSFGDVGIAKPPHNQNCSEEGEKSLFKRIEKKRVEKMKTLYPLPL